MHRTARPLPSPEGVRRALCAQRGALCAHAELGNRLFQRRFLARRRRFPSAPPRQVAGELVSLTDEGVYLRPVFIKILDISLTFSRFRLQTDRKCAILNMLHKLNKLPIRYEAAFRISFSLWVEVCVATIGDTMQGVSPIGARFFAS